jgi:hypothetical protein
MTTNQSLPAPGSAALTRLDRENIERLLKAGHFATAAKIYRFACRCTAAEAERAISEFPR